jgi:hypothetical protein
MTKDDNMLTADTITDDQIRSLQSVSLDTGDAHTEDLCRLALGMTPTIAWNLTPYGARARCADAINASERLPDGACVKTPAG